jgi:hypothetical protein
VAEGTAMSFIISFLAWVVSNNLFIAAKRKSFVFFAALTPLAFFIAGAVELGLSFYLAVDAALLLLSGVLCFWLLRKMQGILLYLLTVAFFTVLNFVVIPLLSAWLSKS